MSKDVREEARKEAETILEEAHREGRAITSQARRERERLLSDARRIRALLAAALDAVDDAGDNPSAARATPAPRGEAA